jgi:3-methyladenine DNA glycosylase/8-oxoguanine DNA glycosylase
VSFVPAAATETIAESSGAAGPIETRFRPDWPLDPAATLRQLWQGPGDPHVRLAGSVFEQAARTPQGPAGLRLEWLRGEVRAQAWGAGAEWILDRVPELLGRDDDPAALSPRHDIVRRLALVHAGTRLVRTGRVMDSLVPAVLSQKVTGYESRRSQRELAARLGEPAPGPLGSSQGLRLPLSARQLATQPDWVYHRAGIERRRADILRRAAAVAERLEEIPGLAAQDGRARLLAIRGIGPWTVAETLRPVLGDPDLVSIGDYHLPNLVSWLLAGEPRGDDTRMLELLEPYRGQRARVVMLLELSGQSPPRFGPRLAPRSIRAI